jgi:RNA polymerase sigma-70 factor (ECF subfamily)
MDGGLRCKTLTCAEQPEVSNLPEAEAIGLAKRGDERGFEQIYRLHSQRVYNLCLRMMRGNAAEAEDLTQEAFLQLFRKISTFRGESAFSTWLHRLAFNIVLMRIRRRRHQVLSLDEILEPGENTTRLQKTIGGRDLRLSGSLDRVDLERALEQLPPGYKAVFILHDVQGYEHKQIADIRGCSLGNSKSQLHKARARMRDLLRTGARDKNHDFAESLEPVLDTLSTV